MPIDRKFTNEHGKKISISGHCTKKTEHQCEGIEVLMQSPVSSYLMNITMREADELLDVLERLVDRDPDRHREYYSRAYTRHGDGLVVTQPEPGKFAERPMTPAELAAREPAMRIAEQIHKLAHYAAFAYIKSWEIIAPAIEAAIGADRETRSVPLMGRIAP